MNMVALERRLAVLEARRQPPAALPSGQDLATALGLTLDPWQAQLLESGTRRILLNVARQGGKSATSALKALDAVLNHDDFLCLIVSPGERQSKLLFEKLLRAYARLGKPVEPRAENKLSLLLRNGSEVHALPGEEDRIRGFSEVNLLLLDEAARVRDEMMAAVRPMLAVSDGQMMAMSTPWGKRGWWYEAWVTEDAAGDPFAWERYEVPWQMIPRIAPEFIEAERRALPSAWFRSEYECQFVEADDAFFSFDAIANAFAATGVEPLFPLDAPLPDLSSIGEVEPW